MKYLLHLLAGIMLGTVSPLSIAQIPLDKSYGHMLDKARQSDSIRVSIGLVPEAFGVTIGPNESDEVRIEKIKEVQRSFLERLSEALHFKSFSNESARSRFNLDAQPRFIPFMTLTVTAEELAAIAVMKGVSSINEPIKAGLSFMMDKRVGSLVELARSSNSTLCTRTLNNSFG